MAHELDPSTIYPNFDEETRLWGAGYRRVAGLDEAGRGALAGPVVAAAVIAPPNSPLTGVWSKVRDSKLLQPAVRMALVEPIQQAAQAWGIGVVPAAVIDTIGIAQATRQAMVEALAMLGVRPDFLLIDWVKLPQTGLPQICVPKADLKMVSVAAASILAKVTRDTLMEGIGALHPDYGFEAHKGYGSARHLAAMSAHGPCPEHRFSFAPIASHTPLFDVERRPAP